MIFHTPYNPPEAKPMPSGTGTIEECQKMFDAFGNPYPTVIGERDLYEEIQSFADEVDFYTILKRCGGDISQVATYQGSGCFADITHLPTDQRGFMQMLRSTQAVFDGLPEDVKSDFESADHLMATLQNPVLARNFAERLVGRRNKNESVKQEVNNNVSE